MGETERKGQVPRERNLKGGSPESGTQRAGPPGAERKGRVTRERNARGGFPGSEIYRAGHPGAEGESLDESDHLQVWSGGQALQAAWDRGLSEVDF